MARAMTVIAHTDSLLSMSPTIHPIFTRMNNFDGCSTHYRTSVVATPLRALIVAVIPSIGIATLPFIDAAIVPFIGILVTGASSGMAFPIVRILYTADDTVYVITRIEADVLDVIHGI